MLITYSHVHFLGNSCTGKGTIVTRVGRRVSSGRLLDPRTRVDIDLTCYLLHRGFVQLVEIQRVDAILCPEDEVLIWREKRGKVKRLQ